MTKHDSQFSDFSNYDQERILREGDRVGERTSNHVVQILIGPPAISVKSVQETENLVHTASGVAFLWKNRTFLATAAHVVEWYWCALKKSPSILFQASNTFLSPKEQLVYYDRQSDIAIIELLHAQREDVASLVFIVDRWPTPVVTGDYVSFAGCPKEYRRIVAPSDIHLDVIGGLLEVTTASPTRLICVLPRERLVASRGGNIPSPTAEFGGMSGGPVFVAKYGEQIKLVGVITDYSPYFDTYYFARIPENLDDLPLPGSVVPKAPC